MSWSADPPNTSSENLLSSAMSINVKLTTAGFFQLVQSPFLPSHAHHHFQPSNHKEILKQEKTSDTLCRYCLYNYCQLMLNYFVCLKIEIYPALMSLLLFCGICILIVPIHFTVGCKTFQLKHCDASYIITELFIQL